MTVSLGPYEVEREIGRGGMGAVLRARAPDGRVVAIKVLLKNDARALERFGREARLLASFSEADGFVPLLDQGSAPTGPYLVMPFLGGGTLRDRLVKGPLPIADVIALAKALARALGKAHAQGIVHRDLKPENVLHADDGRPLVSDLGLAKHFQDGAPGASQSVSLTKTGEIRGTAGYMAPEQLNDSKSVGPAADVFALGAIVYECLVGKPAFAADSMHATFAAIARGTFAPIRRQRPDCPRWLARVVERALQADLARRPADGAALAQALDEAESAGDRGLVVRALLGVAVLTTLAAGVAYASRPAPAPRLVAPPPSPTPSGAVPEGPAVTGDAAVRRPGQVPPELAAAAATRLTKLQLVFGEPRAAGADPERGTLVSALALTPDGRALVSCDHDRAALVRDAATGAVKVRLEGHEGRVLAVAVSADGRRVLTGSADRRVRLFDLATGTLLRTLAGHTGAVRGVAFRPDGALGLSCADDGGLRFWDLVGDAQRDSVLIHGGPIVGLALAPDGKRAISPSHDATVGLISPPGGVFSLDVVAGIRNLDEVIRYARVHKGPVRAAAFNRSGERVLSGGDDKVLHLFELATFAEVRRLEGHEKAILAVAVSPSGRTAVSSSEDGTIRLWELKGGGEVDRIPLAPDRALSLAISPDGRALFAGTARGLVLRFDLAER